MFLIELQAGVTQSCYFYSERIPQEVRNTERVYRAGTCILHIKFDITFMDLPSDHCTDV